MKELLNIPRAGIKKLLTIGWVTYLYHLLFFGFWWIILAGLITQRDFSFGALFGYIILVIVAYMALTSLLLRIIPLMTSPKSSIDSADDSSDKN